MTDTADWLRMYAQQLEDQHAPQNLTIGMRQAADQLDASRETTLQLLGQVGQLSDELERLKDCEARLRAALEEIVGLGAICASDIAAITLRRSRARAALEGPQDRMAKPLEGK